MYGVFIGFSLKAFVSGLETHVTNWEKYGDKQSYNSKPHKWLSLGVNSFTYFFTVLHLVLRLPYNLLHSTYTPFSISLNELLSSFNLQLSVNKLGKSVRSVILFLTSFPKQNSDYYKR